MAKINPYKKKLATANFAQAEAMDKAYADAYSKGLKTYTHEGLKYAVTGAPKLLATTKVAERITKNPHEIWDDNTSVPGAPEGTIGDYEARYRKPEDLADRMGQKATTGQYYKNSTYAQDAYGIGSDKYDMPKLFPTNTSAKPKTPVTPTTTPKPPLPELVPTKTGKKKNHPAYDALNFPEVKLEDGSMGKRDPNGDTYYTNGRILTKNSKGVYTKGDLSEEYAQNLNKAYGATTKPPIIAAPKSTLATDTLPVNQPKGTYRGDNDNKQDLAGYIGDKTTANKLYKNEEAEGSAWSKGFEGIEYIKQGVGKKQYDGSNEYYPTATKPITGAKADSAFQAKPVTTPVPLKMIPDRNTAKPVYPIDKSVGIPKGVKSTTPVIPVKSTARTVPPVPSTPSVFDRQLNIKPEVGQTKEQAIAQSVNKFKETRENTPNIRTDTSESYVKKGQPLKNKPELFVLHHTAAENEKKNEAQVRNTFMNPKSGVSSHVVIEEDGKRTVYANPEDVTFHAGKSNWKGRENVNNFSVGIEFQGNTGKKPLTDKQIQSYIEYAKPIAKKYGISIADMVTHHMVTNEGGKHRKPDISDRDYAAVKRAVDQELKKGKYAMGGTLPQYQTGGTFGNQYSGAQLDKIQYGFGPTSIAQTGGQFQNSGGFEQYAAGLAGGTMQPQAATPTGQTAAGATGAGATGMTADQKMGMAGMGLQGASQAVNIIDSMDGKPSYLGGVASGALSGASMGAAAGPIGAVAGAVIGGGLSMLQAEAKKREEARAQKLYMKNLGDQATMNSQQTLRNYNTQGVTTSGAYAYGGSLPQYANGGWGEDLLNRIGKFGDVAEGPGFTMGQTVHQEIRDAKAQNRDIDWAKVAPQLVAGAATGLAGHAMARSARFNPEEAHTPLYRIQGKDGKTFKQLAEEGKVHPAFNTPEVLARKANEEKHFGQWFTKDKNDLDWYRGDREFTPANSEMIELRVPNSKLNQFTNYDKSLSRAPDREFVVPHTEQAKYKKKLAFGGDLPKYGNGVNRNVTKTGTPTPFQLAVKNYPHSRKDLATGEAGRTDDLLASFLPGTGEATDAISLRNDIRDRNWAGIGLSAAGFALPFVGAYALKKGAKALGKYAPDLTSKIRKATPKIIDKLTPNKPKGAAYYEAIPSDIPPAAEKLWVPNSKHPLNNQPLPKTNTPRLPDDPSRIDWGAWNSELPANKVRMDEYAAIEKASRANGTWMKNPDGTPFKGLPEQFVERQGVNFKKAFPEGFNEVYRGASRQNPELLKPHAPEKTGIFTANKELATNYAQSNPHMYTPTTPTNTTGVHHLAHPKSKNSLEFEGHGGNWTGVPIDPKESSKDMLEKYLKDAESELQYYTNWGAGVSENTRNAVLKGAQKKLVDAKARLANANNIISNPAQMQDMHNYFNNQSRAITDEIATYGEKRGLDYIKINDINDGGLGDVSIVNHKPGNYLKSMMGNNGDWDMTNPNMYKALVPAAVVGAGAAKFANGKEEKKLAFGGKTPRYGGLWDTNKQGFVDSTLNANRNLDFVKRLYEPNAPSIQLPFFPKGERSTHYMASADNMALPTVVRKPGQTGLQYLSGMKHGDPNDPVDYARQTGEYIRFKHPEQAEWFANNGYKKGTGVFNSINTKGRPYNTPGYAKGGTTPKRDIYNTPITANIKNDPKADRSYYDDRLNTMVLGSDYDNFPKDIQDKVQAHENYHAKQYDSGNSNFDIAHNTDDAILNRLRKKPSVVANDEEYYSYHNRKPIESELDIADFRNSNKGSEFIPDDVIFDRDVDSYQYTNPNSLEGAAQYYENTGKDFSLMNKGTMQNQDGKRYAGYAAYGGYLPEYGKGGKIHIKPENRGKFTAYKKRTGKTTEEALHSKDPHVRQMANFARNAAKWKHAYGGNLPQYAYGNNIGVVPKPNLPTAQDSTALYNNALKVQDYYKGQQYQAGTPMSTKYENPFEQMGWNRQSVQDMYANNQTTKVNDANGNITDRPYNPEEYYKPVNENQFYQREKQHGIVDTNSPMPLYDKRIKPQLNTHYKNIGWNSKMKGDEVDIYQYDPIAVQTWHSMNPVQKAERVRKYGVPAGVNYNPSATPALEQMTGKGTSLQSATTSRTNPVVTPVPMQQQPVQTQPVVQQPVQTPVKATPVTKDGKGQYVEKIIGKYGDQAGYNTYKVKGKVLSNREKKLAYGGYLQYPYGGEVGHENPYMQEEFNPNNQGMPNAEYEVEGGEMIQGQQQPMLEDGQQQQVASDLTKVPDYAPSHAEGGVQGAGGERVFSDRMKTANKKTYAKEAEEIGKKKAKYEAKLSNTNEAISNTGHRMTERMDMKLDELFNEQEMKKQLAMPPSISSSMPAMARGGYLPKYGGGAGGLNLKPSYYQGKPLYYDQYNRQGQYPSGSYASTIKDPNAQYFGQGQTGNKYPYPTVFNPSTKKWYAHTPQPVTGGSGAIQYSGQGIQTPTLPGYDFKDYGATGTEEGGATKNALQNGYNIPWQYTDNLAAGIMTANTPELAKPYMDPAVKLNTQFDINPQLQEARNTRGAVQSNIRQNTVQGGAANSNMQQLYASSLDNSNQLYAQKNNRENELKNQEILLNSNINSRNNDKRYAYDVEQTKRRAGIQEDIVDNARNFAMDQYTSARDAKTDARDLENIKQIAMANPNGADYGYKLKAFADMYANDPAGLDAAIGQLQVSSPNAPALKYLLNMRKTQTGK